MISESASGEVPKPKRRGLVGFFVRVLISGFVVWWICRNVLPNEIAATVAEADLFFLVIAFGVLALERAVGVLRWVLLAKVARPGFPAADAVSVFFLSNFVGLALPVSLGGDLARFLGTARLMGRTGDAFRAVLYERIFGLLSLLFALALGAFVAPEGAFGGLPKGPIFFSGSCLLGAMFLPLHRRSVVALSRLLDRRWTRRIARSLTSFGEVLGDRRLTPVGTAVAILLSVTVQLLKVVFTYALGISVGVELGFVYYLALVPVVNLVAQLPLSVGGVGLREGAFLVLFGRLLGGVDAGGAQAVAIAVLSYLGVLLASFPGIFFLIGKGRFPISLRWSLRLGAGTFILAAVGSVSLIAVDSLRARLPWKVREAVERVFLRGVIFSKRLYFDAGSQRVEIPSGTRTLRGAVYLPEGPGPFPGLLLLHGSNSLGRGLGLYRVLAKEFSSRGRLVLCLDLGAFGESDDPDLFDDPSEWDGVADVGRALGWMESQSGFPFDGRPVDLLGHSLGGGVALAAGLRDARVGKIISLGPGRRLGERLSNPEGRDYSARRFARDRRLSRSPPWSLVERVTDIHRIELYLKELEVPGHKPLLLMDGALEDPRDLEFLRRIAGSVAEPKAYVRLSDTAHYLNVLGLSGDDSFGVYDRAVLDEFVDVVERFLESPPE